VQAVGVFGINGARQRILVSLKPTKLYCVEAKAHGS
jgi:hypothetical protein